MAQDTEKRLADDEKRNQATLIRDEYVTLWTCPEYLEALVATIARERRERDK